MGLDARPSEFCRSLGGRLTNLTLPVDTVFEGDVSPGHSGGSEHGGKDSVTVVQHLGSVTGSDWLTQQFPQGALLLVIVEGKLMAGPVSPAFFRKPTSSLQRVAGRRSKRKFGG